MVTLAIRALVVLALVLAAGCGKPTGVPEPSPDSTQKLPFDRESQSQGISPSQSLIPATRHLAEGTAMAIRLATTLSSASAHAGDSFKGTLDDPVVVDGQPLISSGAAVTGRVLDAKHSAGGRDPGYLRIALVSVDVAGKTVLIDTSSIFSKAKVGAHDGRPSPGLVANPAAVANQKDVVFTPDRRLTFHLAQAVDLQ